jgi:uncharacterized membrane protein YoaK (UPF0700 family)
MNKRSTGQRRARAWPVLAFTSGFVDTVGFIVLFGLFTTHLTGNLAVLGAQWRGGQGGVLAKVLAVPVFILVVALTSAFADRARCALRSLSVCFVAEALLMLAFMLLGAGAAPFTDADQPCAVFTGLLGIAAMAVRNAICKMHLASMPPTTVMTGNLTQLVIDLTRCLLPWRAMPDQRQVAADSLQQLLPGLASFMAGSMLGAASHALMGFWAMWVPILCSLALAQLAWHRARLRAERKASLARLQPWAPTRIMRSRPRSTHVQAPSGLCLRS